VTRGLAAYVLDCAPDDRDGALRSCLRCVEAAVAEFECDLPVSQSDPPEVQQSAAVLLRVARRANSPMPATGVLSAGDPAVWEAFVVFAPYALDGSVWTVGGDGRPAVSFSDVGTAVSVRLDADQHRRLLDVLPTNAVLVPGAEWRKRRRLRDRLPGRSEGEGGRHV
jgi:hypothetical protein